MRCIAMVILATNGTSMLGGEVDKPKQHQLTLCMSRDTDFAVIYPAQTFAVKLFAEIGLKLRWRAADSCSASLDVIKVTISNHTAENEHPGSVAYAFPYEGSHIVVLYDRVKQSVPHSYVSHVLAYVLVHEISHVIEGIDRHSESGIMKAKWDDADNYEMSRMKLRFAEDDIILIQAGLEKRAQQERGKASEKAAVQ